MKLLKLTATFGCLNNETLEFSDGMTLIGSPNGSGKSTWCAFLRTMLYGLDTRQRDKKGLRRIKTATVPGTVRPWKASFCAGTRARPSRSAERPPAAFPWGISLPSIPTPACPSPV